MKTATYRPTEVQVTQWEPDPEYARWSIQKGYENRRLGYDRFGVEYTVTECTLQDTSIGPIKMSPGDWIVYGPDDSVTVMTDEQADTLLEVQS